MLHGRFSISSIDFILMKYLVVILGPTAVGKTSTAIRVAQYFNTEIISSDSRQIYKELSIGVAKPSTEELASVPHHFINHISIAQDYTAGTFEQEALTTIEQLHQQQDVVVMAGGSNLYVDAVCNGLDDLPTIPKEVREEITIAYQTQGITYLQNKVQAIDAAYYEQMEHDNPRRLQRVLEIHAVTGKMPDAFYTKKSKERPFQLIKVGLEMDRQMLYNRINRRVDAMMEKGLLEEVKGLLPFRNLKALETVGYQEIFELLDETMELEVAVERIKRNSRRYAKRQLTWLRKDTDIHWIPAGDLDAVMHLIEAKKNSV